MTASPLDFRSLLPSASSYTWIDIIGPPLCLGASLLLHIAYNPQHEITAPDIQASLYRMSTYHARFLPKTSQHAFQYSTINLGVDLDALEAGRLDLGTRWFAYDPDKWTWFAFRNNMFSCLPGSSEDQQRPSARVRALLQNRGVPQTDMAKIYTVAMPAYAGFEGINPLVVHYCYDMPHQNLRVVVLEVHNTFGERHIYVLQTGVDEDDKPSLQHEHQWTFPRAFHVSPFNDRSGYYQVSLIDPLKSSSYSIKILLLEPDHSKKLMATLEGSAEPLSDAAILRSSLLFPLSLLLTAARIVYQAFILHYFKRLNVFARPEPFVGQHQQENSVGPTAAPNGSIHWQQPTTAQLWLRSQFEVALQRCVDQHSESVQVTVQPADFTQPTSTIARTALGSDGAAFSPATEHHKITLRFHSHTAFEELLMAPCFDQAVDVGVIKGTWEVDRPQLLESILELLEPSRLSVSTFSATNACRTLRSLYSRWSSMPQPERHKPSSHWQDTIATWRLALTLAQITATDVVSYYVAKALRAEFVRGGSPWEIWDRIKSSRRDHSEVKGTTHYYGLLSPQQD